MKPIHYALLCGLIGALIGAMKHPLLFIVGGILGFIIGIPIGMKIDSYMYNAKLKERWKKEEDVWDAAVAKLDEYLTKMPITSSATDKIKEWERLNDVFNAHQSDTYYNVSKGSKAKVYNDLSDQMRMFYRFYQKRDPECHGWQKFTAMLNSGSHSCSYRWGVNELGNEVWRVGEDEYIAVKVRTDSYYAR